MTERQRGGIEKKYREMDEVGMRVCVCEKERERIERERKID
jgi:hypothetical protein